MMMMTDVAKIRQSRQVSVLRHVILHQRSTYCARRLLRDLKQIEQNTIPTVGVSGHPLQKDLKKWHANLRGPQSTPYQGGVFHLELTFPDNYPHNPPDVRLLTPIPEHPFALENGTKVCLDMLQTGSNYNKGLYSGWTSGYSVLSILLQLQSFLFELPHDLKAMEPEIRKRVKQANQFVCTNPGCHHKGPIQAWPEFNKKESFLDAFVFTKTEKERLMEETCCFHNRLTMSECSLGVGISVSRLPRTGQIRTIESTLDLLSLKAYIKDNVRKCMSNSQKFTHWLPLYLGHGREKTLHLLRRSLSMVCENTTRKFDPSKHILAVVPKLLVTLAVSMMQEMTHTSIKALRMWTYFIRLFLLLIDEYPEVGKEIKKRVDKFLSSEDERVKDKFSSLGDFLAYVTVSGEHSLNGDTLQAYLGESLDRQVFWMLRDVPELGEVDDKKGEVMDEKRDQVAFKTNMTSNHILLFFYNFNKMIMGKKQSGNMGKVVSQLDSHFCLLSQKMEDEFQRQCEEIRNVKDFASFFAMLGMKQPSKKELTERLRLSVLNSLRKKYHGEDQQINALPKTNMMILEYQKRHRTYKDFWDFNKGKFILQNQNDPEWFNALKERYDWIKQLADSGEESKQLNPVNLAIMSDKLQLKPEGGNQASQMNDKLKRIKQQALTTDTDNMSVRDILLPQERMWRSKYQTSMNWRNLFLKLDFENFLRTFQYNPDFKQLHQYLDKCGPYIEFLQLPIIQKIDIKSGHYWIMVVLSKLQKLRGLTIYQPNERVCLGADGIKYLAKGINNMIEKSSKCNLQLLQFNDVSLLNSTIFYEKFNSILRKVSSNLKILSMKNTNISLNFAKGIQKLLSEGRCLAQLYLENCSIGVNEAKQIADGLMRSKQIEVINLSKNSNIGHGVNLVLYSLAFLPKIRHIDISDIMGKERLNEIAETLYKLLKMSGSLQTLILNRTDILSHLTNEFFKAIGQNATLKHLFMDSNGSQTVSNIQYLGKVIGFNAYKKGSLELVSIKNNNIRRYYDLQNFILSMQLNHRDHEYQYGDRSIADKMQGDDLVQEFYCNLKSFYMSKGNLQSNFRIKDWEKRPNRQLPQLCKLLTQGKLINFEMSDCNLKERDADLFGLAISDPKCTVKALNLSKNSFKKEGAKVFAQKLGQNDKIQALDISYNKLGVSGSKSIAKMLESNKKIKFLNLFCNNMDVDGARQLKVSLSKNTTLQHLDVGFNRLRKKGLLAIASGLFENKQSSLNSIGLRQNFLTDHCFQEFMALFMKSYRSCERSLQRLFIKKNYISELCLNNLKSSIKDQDGEQVKESKPSMTIDAMDKMKYIISEKLERTIWVSPIKQHQTESLIKLFFESRKCGIVLEVRVREGSKVEGKPMSNRYAFVQFAHPTSVLRALKLASKKKSIVEGTRVRIYKAGSKTFNIVKPKKSKSQATIEKRTYGGKTLNLQKKRVMKR